MKLKSILLSAGACAGAFFISLHAQTAGASGAAGASSAAGSTTGATGAAATGSATGSATSGTTGAAGTSTTTSPSGVGTLSGAATLPTGPDAPASVGAETQSDLGPSIPPATTASGQLTTPIPSTSGSVGGVPLGSPISPTGEVNRVSPGTDPLGPTTLTRPTSVTAGSTTNVSGGVGATRAPQTNGVVPPGTTGMPTPATGTRVQRDTLGAPAAVFAPTAPPPATAEVVPASPGANFSWVPGHYTLNSEQWTWVPGAWTVPPTTGAVWVEGRYDGSTQRWLAGHWEPGAGSTR